MCLAGVANGILSVPSMLILWASPIPRISRPGPIASTTVDACAASISGWRGQVGITAVPSSMVLRVLAHGGDGRQGVGHAELGEPVGREAVGLRLGGVLSQLPERSADGDLAGTVQSDAHRPHHALPDRTGRYRSASASWVRLRTTSL